MTDDNNITPVPPAPARQKRQYHRRPRTQYGKVQLVPREAPPPERKSDDFFAGMTPAICASGCSEKGCIITGDVCGHPYKSGLQAKHYMQKDVMARYERAKNFLKHQAIDKRKGA